MLSFPLLLAVLASPSAHADEPVRVATWNIQSVGAPGSAEYLAALDVLTRIGADVVAINEVENSLDAANLESLAADAGYAYTAVSPSGPMGAIRNAVISDLPITATATRSSAELSGDPSANDITRYFLEATVDVTGAGDELTVISGHHKSGWGDNNEFRRVVESMRLAQILSTYDPTVDAVVALGDINEEIDDPWLSPTSFSSVPTGMPRTWSLGSDLAATLAVSGLDNDPFLPLLADTIVVDALQVDGSDATRPTSGRRLDYLWVTDVIDAGGVDAEVFDCADEALGGGLPKYGTALGSSVCADASDHLPVFADIVVPTAPTTTTSGAGLLELTEVMANPLNERTGEYVELYNAGSMTVDLADYVIDDGDSVDRIAAYSLGGSTMLAPGGYALILDPGYADDYVLPADALLLTTGGAAICNGLAVSDTIAIYEADGATLVDSWDTPFNPGNGISAERTATGWEAHACTGSTETASPGAAYCGAL